MRTVTAAGKVSAVRFLHALGRPLLILPQAIIETLRSNFGVMGVNDTAGDLHTADLFFY